MEHLHGRNFDGIGDSTERKYAQPRHVSCKRCVNPSNGGSLKDALFIPVLAKASPAC